MSFLPAFSLFFCFCLFSFPSDDTPGLLLAFSLLFCSFVLLSFPSNDTPGLNGCCVLQDTYWNKTVALAKK
jgi:hypothetical protein